MAIDPICGMTVEEDPALSAARDGKMYYFCRTQCRDKFVAQAKAGTLKIHPRWQVRRRSLRWRGSGDDGSKAASKTDAASSAEIYTCPMHPEIEQRGPGSCPKCGMALEPKSASGMAAEDDSELIDMTRRFWAAVEFGVPVLLLAMLPMVGVPLSHWLSDSASRWLQFALSIPAVCWAGWPLWVRAWRSIVTWNLNMFTLIGLGTGAAFFYSVWRDVVSRR